MSTHICSKAYYLSQKFVGQQARKRTKNHVPTCKMAVMQIYKGLYSYVVLVPKRPVASNVTFILIVGYFHSIYKSYLALVLFQPKRKSKNTYRR